MKTNYIDEILKEFEEMKYNWIKKEPTEYTISYVDFEEIKNFLKQKLQEVEQKTKQDLEKNIEIARCPHELPPMCPDCVKEVEQKTTEKVVEACEEAGRNMYKQGKEDAKQEIIEKIKEMEIFEDQSPNFIADEIIRKINQ